MKDNEQGLPIQSTLDKKSLKVGSHVFTADFGYMLDEKGENGKFAFVFSEFEIKKIVKDHINNKVAYYEIFNVKSPKQTTKTDLESGFFNSEHEAAKEFVESMHEIFIKAQDEYNKLFS